ncbi:short chain dehydrogenase/reductase [Aspergillus ellipticus CBS 707.79]|uniref:Short chain dehydrogenase/reductase n=1 Tax=Aspergillus ellipticus CBS 707.79 TaxID=1448320 RepID=A0A319CX20_9EURO|nr:short chain dehydrogenase/reductase [Aspergillus ellipticus CBS 707.79]
MASTIVLITGANSGIGLAISKVLVRSDTIHVILASRTLEKAQQTVSEIEAEGTHKGTLSAVKIDVTSPQSITDAATHIENTFNRLDVLINNAGVSGMGITDTQNRFQTCLETNVTGPALISEAFRPLLFKSQNPYSIFVGSGDKTVLRNATKRVPHSANLKGGDAYQVSKAALNMLAIMEARDYGERGLKVFVLAPGFMRSKLRGSGEDEMSGWGRAGDPEVVGEMVWGILRGERDSDVGCFVHRGGVYEW